MPFTVEPTDIPEVLIVRPRLFPDDRGWFTEVARTDVFAELGHGLPVTFAQVNQSRSERGVIVAVNFRYRETKSSPFGSDWIHANDLLSKVTLLNAIAVDNDYEIIETILLGGQRSLPI